MTQGTEASRLRRMSEHIQFMNEEITAMVDQRLDAWSALIVFSARRAMGAELIQIHPAQNSTQSTQTLMAFCMNTKKKYKLSQMLTDKQHVMPVARPGPQSRMGQPHRIGLQIKSHPW